MHRLKTEIKVLESIKYKSGKWNISDRISNKKKMWKIQNKNEALFKILKQAAKK